MRLSLVFFLPKIILRRGKAIHQMQTMPTYSLLVKGRLTIPANISPGYEAAFSVCLKMFYLDVSKGMLFETLRKALVMTFQNVLKRI